MRSRHEQRSSLIGEPQRNIKKERQRERERGEKERMKEEVALEKLILQVW